MSCNARRPRRTRGALGARAIWLVLGSWAGGCTNVGAPPPDAEYPAWRLPARLEPTPTASAPAKDAPPASPEGGATRVSPAEPVPAGAEAQPSLSRKGYLPDPPALAERRQWDYTLYYDRGSVHAGEPKPVCLRRPATSPRRMGRFAFELWLGRELIERIRFDFPLLAAEVPNESSANSFQKAPSFAPGARVSIPLQVPGNDRATRALILDRATGETWPVAWPPASTNSATPDTACAPPGASEPKAAPQRSR